jgi:hypothetical protein
MAGSLQMVTEWYFPGWMVLPMVVYVMAIFHWYFPEMVIFRSYRTNFPKFKILTDYEQAYLGFRQPCGILEPISCADGY